MKLADLFLRAVREPELLEARDVRACITSVASPRPDSTGTMELRVLLATIYARPDLLDGSVIRGLRCFLSQGECAKATASLTSAIFQGLIMTSLGAETIRAIENLLILTTLPETTRAVLLDALEHAALWRRDLLDVEPLVSLCERDPLATSGGRMLTQLVEPCLLARPDLVDDELLRRLACLFALHSRPAYCLAYLAARPDMCEPSRRIARDANRGIFPLGERVGAWLREGERQILVVHNIDDAQGDEIIRVVPLLQALLDCNPASHATVLTPRRYLYAHPRVSPVAINHGPAVHAALLGQFDVVIDFFHPVLNHGVGLERAVLEYQRTRRPFLSLGCSKADESYVYDRVEINGRPYAEERGLDRQRVLNVYETTFRLLAELGLPIRTGEMSPEVPVLAGIWCPEGEAAWGELVRGNTEGRRVALVNPFGGHEALKGYVDQTMRQLADRLRALIAEEFFVVVLPNGLPWGWGEKLDSALGLLTPDERAYVTAAPDPQPRGESATCSCSDVPLPYRSSLMRHFLQFVRRADLTVAVEGWAIHVAYLLGKPYQALTMPCSLPVPWLPYGGSDRQVIAPPTPSFPSDLRDAAVAPPLDEQPRSLLLRSLLAALGSCPELDVLPPLLHALRSEDRQVRLEALRALRWFRNGQIYTLLLDRLHDTFCEVRGVAAAILLDSGQDWSSALGPSFKEQLQAHVIIGGTTSDWHPLLQIRDGARIALEAALHDDYPSVQRRAAELVHLLDYYHINPPRQPDSALGKLHVRRVPRVRPILRSPESASNHPSVLIATPLKDATDSLGRYSSLLESLSYPRQRLSLGMLESDSQDGTYAAIRRKLPELRRAFRRVGLWKRDFSYLVPPGYVRGDVAIQMERRRVLAWSRNHLLARALEDEDWVLWLDVDVIDYPSDVVDQLLASGKDIVTPHCVLRHSGRSFDRNAWCDRGALFLEDLREEGEVVPLHGVGGTMLLVRADLHREGLVFPPYLYGAGNPLCRHAVGEIETEGLGIMAHDMGYRCWGMPNLEIRHRDQ